MKFKDYQLIQTQQSNPNCLKVLPLQPSNKIQNIVVGETQGQIQIFDFSNKQNNLLFKSLAEKKEVAKITLGGNLFVNRNLIYYSQGVYIKCINHKGKQQLSFDSNSTQVMHNIGVHNNYIWTAGDYLLNEFQADQQNVKDINYYASQEKINDMYIHQLYNDSFTPILGCQENIIRVIKESQDLYNYQTDSSVNCMSPFSNKSQIVNSQAQMPKDMIFGLGNGNLMLLQMQKDKAVFLWSLQASQPINQLKVYDINKNGLNDVIITKDLGQIEVYQQNQNEQLEMSYQKSINEAIVSLDIGSITIPNVNEFVIQTHSGNILGFIDEEYYFENQLLQHQGDNKLIKDKISQLQNEIDQLSNEVKDEKNKQKIHKSNFILNNNAIKISHKIIKEQENFIITFNSPKNIDMICFNSNTTIEIINFDEKVSIYQVSENPNLNQLSGVFKITENQLNYEIKFRPIEGCYGYINFFVFPQDDKICQQVNIQIQPLSLHKKVQQIENIQQLPLNQLSVQGQFSQSEIHNWIYSLLPDISNNFEDGNIIQYFKQNFIQTILKCEYCQNKAQFYSESISTLSIIKDFIQSQASMKSINIEYGYIYLLIDVKINEDSNERVFQLLSQRFQDSLSIQKQIQILNPLLELEVQEGNQDFLPELYQNIIKEQNNLRNSSANNDLSYLKGIICDLYNDFKKMTNTQTNKIKEIQNLLNQEFDIDQLKQLFSS